MRHTVQKKFGLRVCSGSAGLRLGSQHFQVLMLHLTVDAKLTRGT